MSDSAKSYSGNIREDWKATMEYRKIRVLGTEYSVLSTGITREDIERAGDSRLASMIASARLDIELATEFGRPDIAEEVQETVKQMRAQQAINAAARSIEYGLMCGVV